MGKKGLYQHKKGFTLIELLVVVGILAVLAAIVFVAIDPAVRFASSRNSARLADSTSILNALLQYQVDVPGNQLPNLTPNDIDSDAATIQMLGTTSDASGCPAAAGACPGSALTFPNANCFVDLSASDLGTSAGNQTIVDTYIAKIPPDPLDGTAAITKYYVNKSAGGRITIGSCDQELSQSISVTR
jgi:type IV pilus assembly protein PilA